MNKNLSKVLLTSASAVALLAAYPSIASTANETLDLDAPVITAQAAASRTGFLRTAQDLPQVSEIEDMNASELAAAGTDAQNVRAAYNSLSASDRNDSAVVTWEGHLTAKENALGTAFLRQAQALPIVTDIDASDASEINAVRSAYNALPVRVQSNSAVTLWEGHLSTKEAALPADNARRFIVAARELPFVSDLNTMSTSELAQAYTNITSVRGLYNRLTPSEEQNADVQTWEGHLTEKERPAGILFVRAANNLPTLSEISDMDEVELQEVQEAAAAVRTQYNNLSDLAQGLNPVSTWEGHLSSKEAAIAERLGDEDPDVNLDEVKEAAQEELANYVDTDDFNDYWTNRINSIINAASDNIDEATTPARVQTLLANAQAQIDEVPTLAELEAETLVEAREAAKGRLANFAANNRSRYSGNQLAEFDAIIARATTQYRVGTLEEDAYAAIGELTADATPEEILAAAQEDAVEELENYVDADDYTENADALEAAIAAGIVNIEDAASLNTVDTALADAKAAIDEIADDSETLAAYKVRLIDILEDEVDVEDYTTNSEALNTAITEGTAAINAAETREDAYVALVAAQEVIEGIESDLGIAAREANEALEEYNISAGAYQNATGSKDDDVYHAAFVAQQELLATLDAGWVEEDIAEATDALTEALTNLDNATAALENDILSNATDALAPVESALAEFTEAGGNESSKFYTNVVKATGSLETTLNADPQDFSEIKRTTNNLNNLVDDLNARTEQMEDQAAEQALGEATAAVQHAENYQTQENVDAAQELINALPEGEDRDDLQERLDEVAGNVALQTAIDAVDYAENLADALNENSTAGQILDAQNAVSEARTLVNALPASSTKVSLQGQVNAAEFTVGQYN